MNLPELFQHLNSKYFEGQLDEPVLKWNSRLRSSAGRFIPGTRSRVSKLNFWSRATAPLTRKPVIEIATYLKSEAEAQFHIQETLAHEMIHYWLWVRKRPYGHNEEFYAKMKLLGVRRYNPIPKRSPPKYLYRCDSCLKEFPARRKLGLLACAGCCKSHSHGRFDERFKLRLEKTLR